MLYTPSHVELAQHPKTRKLARLLGVSIPTAIGHLHLLWHFALKYAPDGDLARFDADEIADGCLWEGDPAPLFASFVNAGWVNNDATIHDWQEYGGKAIKQKEDNAERQQRWRDRHKTVSKPSPNRPVTVTSPLYNALEEKRLEETKDYTPPTPPPAEVRRAMPANVAPIDRGRRDDVWDALVEGTGISPQTSSERSRFGKSVAELLALDATRPEILSRCQHYKQHFPNAALTDRALVNNWSSVAAPPSKPRTHGKMSQAEMNSGKQRRFVD